MSDRLFQRIAIGWVIVPLAILLCAAVLSIGEDRKVLVPWFNVALPETCSLYARFGVDCPGCGLTRSFIEIAHANPMAALHLQPLSWILFAYVAAQIPLAIYHVKGIPSETLNRLTRVNEWGLVSLAIALLLLWFVKLLVRYLL